MISGVPFQIAFPDADDMIKVTFTQHIGAVPPFRLQYEFQRLKVNFSIGPAESTSANEIPGVEILSKGTDPTAVATVSMHSDRGTTAHYFRIKVTAPIAASTKPTETLAKISLDNIYDKIVPGGWILLEGTNQSGHFINAAAKKAKSFQIKTTQPLAAGQILTVALGSPHQEDVTVESYVPSTNTVTITGKFDHDHPEGTYLLWTALDPLVSRVKAVSERSRADYGITGKITEVTLDGNKTWLDLPEPDALGQPDLSVVRRVAVFAQSEKLELAEQPIDPLPLSLEKIDSIELDGIYPGLESGRWLIVSGKRADIHIPAAELVMLAGSEQKASKCDKLHTFLNLAGGLSYDYEPGSVTIYGNVAHATHGETRAEVLGSGDSSHPLQQFQLKQSSITYVSAATPNGIESTLKVRVNDILWHEAPGLAFLGPNGRSYVTRTGDDSKTTVVFGNGVRGARVPTGVENVKAVYRTGIGKPGNVKAEQISLLATKPLGVKDVINPIRASGGADRESRDQARRNAPLAVMALDRLVSIQDYADFARTFAGVGKASATQIGGRVHVTIAGADSIPIDKSSDLILNLMAAFGKFGDPQQPIQLDVCMPMLLVIQAKVAILPDYQFETVAPKIHNALLAALSFDNRGLGQDVIQSEIIATIQSVEGVQYVDLDTLDTLSMDMDAIFKDLDSLQKQRSLRKRIPVELAHRDSSGNIVPAQLAFLTPDISETLILTEFTDAR